MNNITVLLLETEGAVNLGFIARAMANTGHAQLGYTGELAQDDPEALKYAVHADSILNNAVKHPDTDALLTSCDVLFGFSPRSPWEDGHDLPFHLFAETVQKHTASGQSVGLLFGNEARGLSNEELSWCRYRVALPTDPAYVSMNLAQAVMVTLWELQRSHGSSTPQASAVTASASPKMQAAMLNKLAALMSEAEFLNEQNPELITQEMRTLFASRDWTEREMTLLTGFVNKTLAHMKALKKRVKTD